MPLHWSIRRHKSGLVFSLLQFMFVFPIIVPHPQKKPMCFHKQQKRELVKLEPHNNNKGAMVIELAGKTVCFTGNFSNGMKRDALFAYAKALGAKPIKHVTKTLGALVVGNKGNKQWINPDEYGTKILQVRELNKNKKEDEDKILIFHPKV